MNGFSACGTGARNLSPDPSKRVNFMQGLVLGVDELTQESAYLANRAEWLARDLLGHGTVIGLRVSRETRANGPAIVVGAGIALSPRGRPIRVTMPQALALNEWLDARRNEITPYLVPSDDSPPRDHLKVFVVLSYQQCVTDNQPGPGEPCRTDEVPQIYTRIADDFRLDLRFAPPDRRENDATRGFVSWLGRVEFVEHAPTATLDEFLAALRAAALSDTSLDFLLESPPAPLRVHVADATDFFRAAFVVWTTELKPILRIAAPDDDALLLAEVELPIRPAPNGRWAVDDPVRIALNEDRRPYLVSLRLLQELVVSMRSEMTAQWDRTLTEMLPPFSVVAAGIITGDPTNRTHRQPLFNGLTVTSVTDGVVNISFDGYEQPSKQGPFQYIVKATARSRTSPLMPAIITLGTFGLKSIRLDVVALNNAAPIPRTELKTLEMAIEVMRYPAERRS